MGGLRLRFARETAAWTIISNQQTLIIGRRLGPKAVNVCTTYLSIKINF